MIKEEPDILIDFSEAEVKFSKSGIPGIYTIDVKNMIFSNGIDSEWMRIPGIFPSLEAAEEGYKRFQLYNTSKEVRSAYSEAYEKGEVPTGVSPYDWHFYCKKDEDEEV